MRTTFAIAIALMLTLDAQARPIVCSSKPILNGSWRLVDNKKCWHPGRRRIDKTQLTWRVLKSEPARIVKRKRPPAKSKNDDDLCCTIWPKPSEFDKRFQGVR